MHTSLGNRDSSVDDLLATLAALVKRRAEVDRMIALLESIDSIPSIMAGVGQNSYQQ